MIECVFTPTQKQEMVRKLTDTMVSIEGENMRPVTLVVVEEVKSGNWGIGGNPLTTSDAKALAAGKSKSCRLTMLQRIRPSRGGCNRGPSWAGSLSLGR
jgi:4-oxalocrotonate tautomerase